MTFRLLVNEIRLAVSTSLINLGYTHQDFDVSEPPRKEFGDLTCNIAFQLSKKLKKPPFSIAKEIVDKQLKPYFDTNKKNSLSFVQSVESHHAGYINFKADLSTLATNTLNEALTNPSYGFNNFGNGKHVLIEHTSVNPNKALHVGHMRNVVIGDTMYRIMKATNHKVTVLNYVDDSGLQVADLIVGFRYAGFPLEPKEKSLKFDHYCGNQVYVKVNDLYREHPSLEEKRRCVLRELEQGTTELAKFASEVTMRVLRDQLKTSWRIKAHYDLLNFESHIVQSKLWAKVFDLLKEKKIATLETIGKNSGCWVIKIEQEEDKIIIRRDGTTTYIAKDIPYAAWKLGIVQNPFFYYKFADQWDGSILSSTTLVSSDIYNLKFNSGDLAITVIDSRQDRLQRIISKVLTHLQMKDRGYHHLGYESVTLSSETAKIFGVNIGERKFMHMSGRKGIQVNADYVLDLLHAKAYAEVKLRNPDLAIESLHEIAEEITVSAIRYNLIKQDLDKIITFDVIESLNMAGDSGPYLQYAYARSQHILEKSCQYFSTPKFDLLVTEQEVDVIKEIAKFDLVVQEAIKKLNPKLLARYAYRLATSFNLFYEKTPVLKERNKEVMNARLALVKAFGMTLRNILNVLGITPLNQM